MSREIPILFSTPMVQAILDGRKTMIRRVVKKQPTIDKQTGDWYMESFNEVAPIEDWVNTVQNGPCPYGQPGDILWVRECAANLNVDFPSVVPYWIYKADIQIKDQHGPVTWKPSIHMPKSACRIWLEVTDVRVERLQNINPNDACEEGVEYWNIDGDAMEGGELVADFKNYTWTEKKEDDPNYEDRYFPTFANPCDSFRTLWQSINGPESWDANPWVWVVSFKVLSTTGRPEIKKSTT